jgi:hypothetical protein
MIKKLGKKAASHSIRYKFTDVFDPAGLPKPPPVFGHHAAVQQYHMLGNDTWGDCVWAGAAHEEYLWSLEGGAERTRITTADVLQDYAACTGFAYTDETDNGTDMALAAKYRQKTGIRDAVNQRHKIDSFVSLEVGNLDQVFLAIWLLGAVGVGIQLTKSAEDQSDANGEGKTGVPWTVPHKRKVEGGHYVSGVGRDKDGNLLVVTWGTVQAMTPEYFNEFNDEGVAYLSLDILNSKGLSPEGYDADFLREIIGKLHT